MNQWEETLAPSWSRSQSQPLQWLSSDTFSMTPLPIGWKPIYLDRYDGTTNPKEHLEAYLT